MELTPFKYQNAAKLYEQLSKQNTGVSGYNNGLAMAKTGANQIANEVQGQVQTNARNSGLNKSASSMMGNQAVANAYNNNIATQQSLANQYQDNEINTTGNLMTSYQTEANNQYKRGWGNVGNVLKLGGQLIADLPKLSDERVKDYTEADNLIDNYSQIQPISYNYNDKAKEVDDSIDTNKNYVGVKAQDLEDNPATPNVVKEDSEGYKELDTTELTSNNTAVIAELCRKVKEISEMLNSLIGVTDNDK